MSFTGKEPNWTQRLIIMAVITAALALIVGTMTFATHVRDQMNHAEVKELAIDIIQFHDIANHLDGQKNTFGLVYKHKGHIFMRKRNEMQYTMIMDFRTMYQDTFCDRELYDLAMYYAKTRLQIRQNDDLHCKGYQK